MIDEDTYAPNVRDREPGRVEEPGDLVEGEATARATLRSGVVEELGGLCELAGHSARQDGRGALGDQQAEGASGAEHVADPRQCLRGVGDDLEDAVAEHQVGACGVGNLGEGGQVALARVDGDAGLTGPAIECRERVRAGVDDGDLVTQAGDAYR